MWTYKYTDELYHYGIPGMKWGHHKRAVASTGGLSGYIRGRQMTNATNNLSAISKRQRQINSELKELRGYEKNPSAIGKTKLATAIRRSQIKSLEKTQSKLQKSKRDNEDALKELKSIDKYQAQKKAERESYKNSPEYKAKQAKMEKAVKVGAAVTGTALAAYGAYKVAKLYSKKTSDLAEKMKMGRDEVSNLFKEYSSTTNFGDNVLSDRTTVNYIGFDGKAKKAVGDFARNTGKGVLAETNVEANVLTDKIVNPRNQSLTNRVKTGVNDVIVRGAQKKYLKKYGSYNYK